MPLRRVRLSVPRVTRVDVPSAATSVSFADTVATRIAAELRAAKLLLVAGVPGVLADPKDPSTRIPRLTPADADRLIADGTISGGMIPKVQEALGGLTAGIEAVHVCGAGPGQVVAEAAEAGSSGTVFAN